MSNPPLLTSTSYYKRFVVEIINGLDRETVMVRIYHDQHYFSLEPAIPDDGLAGNPLQPRGFLVIKSILILGFRVVDTITQNNYILLKTGCFQMFPLMLAGDFTIFSPTEMLSIENMTGKHDRQT